MNDIDENECNMKQVRMLNTVQSYGQLIVLNSKLQCQQWSQNISGITLNMPIAGWSTDIENELKFKKINYTTRITTPIGQKLMTVTCSGVKDFMFLEFEPEPIQSERIIQYVLTEVQTSVKAIGKSQDVSKVLQIGADLISLILPFDRVLCYLFDDEYEGVVRFESNNIPTDVSLIGLRFHSYEIPQSARRMYDFNPLRIIHDSQSENVSLTPDTELDMSPLFLRGANATHCMYLQKFGVVTSASAAIHCNNRLWGMFICHTYKKPLHIPAWARKCIVDVIKAVSSRVTSVLDKEELSQRRQMDLILPRQGPDVLLHDTILLNISKALECSAIFIKLHSTHRQMLYTNHIYHRRINELLRTSDMNMLLPSILELATVENKHRNGAVTTFSKFPNNSDLYCGVAIIQHNRDVIMLFRPEVKTNLVDNMDQTQNNYIRFVRSTKEVSGECKPWKSETDRMWLQKLYMCLSLQNLEVTMEPPPKKASFFSRLGCIKSALTDTDTTADQQIRTERSSTALPDVTTNTTDTTDTASIVSATTDDTDLVAAQHIIVCDDNDITRKMLVRLIEKLSPDSKCVPLEDGIDAVRYYIDNCRSEDNKVTHILSDRHMNFFDGDDAVQVIRKIEQKENRKQPLVVFMLTSDRSTDVVDSNLVQKLLVKPVTVTELREFLAAS